MRMNFLNISFKGVDTSAKNKKTSKQNKNMSLPRYSEMNKHRRNESIVDKYDNGSSRTQEKFGVSYPTPYDFCYEKMSFENDRDDADFFRDSEFEQDKYNRHFDYDADYATTIEDLQYRYQNYSYDDIPLSESLVRRDNGFYETPSVEIDTDMDEEAVLYLDFINYRDNVIPAALKDDTNDVYDFAIEAAALKRDGYSSQSIARALERCYIGSGSTKQPNAALFSFLVKHPNLRPDVLAKHPNGGEMFDKGFANFYGVFEEYYFNNEKDIKEALNLCKIKDCEVKLVSKNLCEIVGLIRHKTAQGIPYEAKPIYDDGDSERNKQEKYVDKSTPLSQNDLELLDQLKTNGRLDDDLFELAKNLLGQKKETVSYTLECIEKFIFRRDEINKLKSTLVSKYPDPINESFINGIKFILSGEAKSAVKSTGDLSKHSHLFNVTKKLIKEGTDVKSIAVVLERLHTIQKQKYSQLNDKLVNEFTTLLKEKNNDGGNIVDDKLADILTKLVTMSKQITKVDVEIISLLKENKSKDAELLDLANNMLHRVNDKYKVLEAIKKKLASTETAKADNVKKEESGSDNVVLDKSAKNTTDNKAEKKTVKTEEIVNGDIIITKAKGDNVASVISMPKPKTVIRNADNIYIVNGKVVGTPVKVTQNVHYHDNLSEEAKQNIQLAKISKMLFSSREDVSDVVSAGKIISVIQSSSEDKQMWLDFVDAMLTQGLSNRNILDSIKEKKSSGKVSFNLGNTKINYSDNYINKLVQERLSEEQVKSVDERMKKDLEKKQTKNNAGSTVSKPVSGESYMSKLIRERLSAQQVKKVNERIDKDAKLAHERNQEALKSLDKKSSITKSDEVKVDEEYVVNRLMNVQSSEKDSAGRIIAKISNANKEEKKILIKLVNNMLNQKHSCYSILMAIASR